MKSFSYELFVSYCRRDNEPLGWVREFVKSLRSRHAQYSGRELNIFFDEDSIDEGADWRRRLGQGIRESRLFLAFLSPHYITSPNCLWEWEEYLRREHSAARGDDGLTQIFFVKPADLRNAEQQKLVEWLREMEQRYPWFKAHPNQLTAETERLAVPFIKDINRRHQSHHVELHDWYQSGEQALRELDAASRSSFVKAGGRDPASDSRSFAERLEHLDRHIARRLDRIALADLAPGNIARSHEHFVGRHRELSELHDIMLTGGPQNGGRGMGGRGMIAATFSPGGLGKTALARQYAHAYAEFYAAGGTWEIGCEGISEIGAAMLRLADSKAFHQAAVLRFNPTTQTNEYLTPPLALTEVERSDYTLAAEAIFDYLRRLCEARVERLREQLRQLPNRHCPEHDPPELQSPRALLILDNVDQPELLSAVQRAQLPAEAWLEIIVTTRLDPTSFGGDDRSFEAIEVGVLPEPDAVRLLADFQPAHRFANDAEEVAAREIARYLGGYTLAVELVAAYLGSRAKEGYQPSHYLPQLQVTGLTRVDDLADEPGLKGQIRHSNEMAKNHIATLIGWSLDRLTAPARTALEFASLLLPDEIPLDWLKDLTANCHQEELAETPSQPSPWHAVWRELRGLRLLGPTEEIEKDDRGLEAIPTTVRVHRLVAQHVVALCSDVRAKQTKLDGFMHGFATMFEQEVGQTDDGWLRTQHLWLRDQLEYLIKLPSPTATLLSSAGVVASYEGEHGSLARAIACMKDVLSAQEQLLRDNPQSAQTARDVSVALERLADFLARRSQPGDAEQALGFYLRALQVSEQLLRDNPLSAQAARDVSVILIMLADFLASRSQPGDAEQALAFYQRALQVREQLVRDNPLSAQAARDVSVSLERLADFLARRSQPGDAEQVLGYYLRALQVSEQLLRDNPLSAQAARDVSVSLEKLADILARRSQPGDAEQAWGFYQSALQVREQLRRDNPLSAQAARDVSASLERLADFLVRRSQPGDAEQAWGFYQRALEVREQLLRDNPLSAQAAREVSISLNKLADFLVSRSQPGDAERALGFYQRALEGREQLLRDNPLSAQAARDVSVSLNKLADFLALRSQPGDAEQALAFYQRCLSILEQLLRDNPKSAQAARDVSVSLEKLADFLAHRSQPGDAEQAWGFYQRALEVSEQLLRDNPQSAEAMRDVLVSLERMAAMESRRENGAPHALALQTRSLQLALRLCEANQTSYYHQRTAVVSYYLTFQYAQAAGVESQAFEALAGCYSILRHLVENEVALDPAMRQLYEQLHRVF